MKNYTLGSLALAALLMSTTFSFAMIPDLSVDDIKEDDNTKYYIKQKTQVGDRIYYWRSEPLNGIRCGSLNIKKVVRTSNTLDKELGASCNYTTDTGRIYSTYVSLEAIEGFDLAPTLTPERIASLVMNEADGTDYNGGRWTIFGNYFSEEKKRKIKQDPECAKEYCANELFEVRPLSSKGIILQEFDQENRFHVLFPYHPTASKALFLKGSFPIEKLY